VFDHAPSLSVSYNRLPSAPTNLAVNNKACGATPLLLGSNFTYVLAATDADPDNDNVSTEFD
jgi:hypothetical protein